MQKKEFDFDAERAIQAMDYNKVDKVLVTATGEFFLESAEPVCKSHCARLGIKYTTIDREGVLGKAKSVAKLIDFSKMKKSELIAFAKENNIVLTKKTVDEMEVELSQKWVALHEAENDTEPADFAAMDLAAMVDFAIKHNITLVSTELEDVRTELTEAWSLTEVGKDTDNKTAE